MEPCIFVLSFIYFAWFPLSLHGHCYFIYCTFQSLSFRLQPYILNRFVFFIWFLVFNFKVAMEIDVGGERWYLLFPFLFFFLIFLFYFLFFFILLLSLNNIAFGFPCVVKLDINIYFFFRFKDRPTVNINNI